MKQAEQFGEKFNIIFRYEWGHGFVLEKIISCVENNLVGFTFISRRDPATDLHEHVAVVASQMRKHL